MDELENQEFDLEDILKEFGGELTEEEQISAETEEEAPAEPQTQTEEEPEEAEQPEVPVVTGDTIRMDVSKFGRGETHYAAPLEEPEETEEEQPYVPPHSEKAEPFSEDWEPEYEQPISDYTPPVIPFPNRSRLRELKRDLVAGPEKRYYNLLEKGLGKLQTAIFASALVVVLSAVTTALHALGFVPPERTKLMVFGQVMAMLICALLGSFQLLEGLADLKHKRFSLNTLLVFTFVLCCADGVLCFHEQRLPCCAAFSLQMTMSLWSSYQKRNTELGQMDTMRKATRLDALGSCPDYYEGTDGVIRGEGQVSHFMDTYETRSRLEKVISVYAMVCLCVSVAVGILAGVLHGLSMGLQVAAVTTLASLPASMFVTMSRPMAVLERRLHSLGAVLCGWQGVEGLSRKLLFPVDHTDLFPAGSVKLNGVKFYGDRESDQVVAYCASLIAQDGGGLEPIFNHLLESRNVSAYPVEEFRAYGNGGIGGVMNDEPVLVGTLSFLKEMGVEVPQSIRVSHAIGISVDGELCGLFALAYDKVRGAAAGLATLCGYRGLRPVLTTGDFMLTDTFLHGKFGINPKKVLFPDHSQCAALREKTLEPDAPVYAMSTEEGLASFAYCVTGARAVKSACTVGVAVHMAGGILGMLMMLVLAILGHRELLTPASMFLYELIWMVPGLLITTWTRNI